MLTLLSIVGSYLLISLIVYICCVVDEILKYRDGKYSKFPVNKTDSHKTYTFVGVAWLPLLGVFAYYGIREVISNAKSIRR